MTQEKISSLVYGHPLSLATPFTKMQYLCRLQSTGRVLRKCGGKHVNYVAKANIPHFRNLGRMGTGFGCSDLWDRLGWTSVSYDWLMVFKAAINQS